MRGILTLVMLIAAYSFASIDEYIAPPSEIEKSLSDDIFEGTVIDIRDDGTGTYNIIHLRSGDLEWSIRYFDQVKNDDSGLVSLREAARQKGNIRVELDCVGENKRDDLYVRTSNQGRLLRNIHIIPNKKGTCQVISSTML
ncbi:hypothetical protein MD588_11300 [Photobacterium sp. SDRW27]|uniref:hypothetical protein n=1 Tax=Photobacterium obscurum TaxID=2829490 RepID=UPI0022437AF4|nr:hypothetical protein [Photobacterium obscurum]MCW8329394.1 hypothetical protein [Photobacterium obscurum]